MFQAFCIERSGIVIEGLLEKRGWWNPSWRSRYFILESRGRLSYFKNKSDSTVPGRALGAIPISVQTTIVPARIETQTAGAARGSRAIFAVRVPGGEAGTGRSFLLSAPTREEGERWTAALEGLRRRVLYVAFPLNARHW